MLMHSDSSQSLSLIPSSEIRKMVARGFSEMYGTELPEYLAFTAPVEASNLEELPHHQKIKRETLMEEKHGAIRVPGAMEMRIVTRIFALMGMYPVEFYDMTILGEKSLPMTATAFRPIDDTIEDSAFRMFCSMLHADSIPASLREEVLAELDNNRKLFPKFSTDLLSMMDKAERQGGLMASEAKIFTSEVVRAFRMHKDKIVDFNFYSKLRRLSDPLADIALESPVLNHLTPRALNIQDAVKRLVDSGIPMQVVIQGPPIREDGVALQLNQIARVAAGEDVYAAAEPAVLVICANDPRAASELKAIAPRIELRSGERVDDYINRVEESLKTNKVVIVQHKARFGEIESRGVALTMAGEEAYNAYGIESETDPEIKKAKIESFKSEYPRSHRQLHDKGWAYYTYQLTISKEATGAYKSVQGLEFSNLLDLGYISLQPQTYDDFLPFSAAAIFAANLTTGTEGISNGRENAPAENKLALEAAMGTTIRSRHDLHRRDQERSLQRIYRELGLVERQRDTSA